MGNGLNSARKSILLKNFTKTHQNLHGEHYVTSACFKSLGNKTDYWKFDSDTFHIRHDSSSTNSFQACYREALIFIENSNIDRPEELVSRHISAMSFFYDRMKDIRVVKKEHGYVKVRDYFIYGENICNGAIKLRRQNLFLCMDLAYIFAYLHDGLGLPLYKDIWVCYTLFACLFSIQPFTFNVCFQCRLSKKSMVSKLVGPLVLH